MNLKQDFIAPDSPNRIKGFALLESMLALLIFSLGILALIGFQAITIRQSGDARFRANAAFLANSFEGDLWGKDIATLSSDCNNKEIPKDGDVCMAGWKNRLAVLPNARATITVTNTDNVEFNIFWKLPGESSEHKYVHIAEINRN